jgi:hypothetical protein
MKNTLKLLALPALFAASCGIDSFFGDGGNLDGSSNVCSGQTVYRIENGNYQTQTVTNISDTCNTPALTAAMLMSDRSIMNDGQGNITVTSTASGLVLGTGAVRCNTGSLTNEFFERDTAGACNRKVTRTSTITVTADKAFTLVFSESLSDFSQVQGGPNCTPKPCTISFTLSMRRP